MSIWEMSLMTIARKNSPSWSDAKARLAELDRTSLLGLLKDLYSVSKDNQAFLNARLGLGDDPLKLYKATITQWINPADVRKPVSVAKAKKAISDYKKALGQPEGLAELTVFYCEETFNLLTWRGVEDESFYDALVRMFEQALKYVLALPQGQQVPYLGRLEQVRDQSPNVGWGVAEDFDQLWADAGLAEGA